MDKFIVITTINEPTKAIRAFSKWKDWQVVVVGDVKTPYKLFLEAAGL